jgi:hypothetical protein
MQRGRAQVHEPCFAKRSVCEREMFCPKRKVRKWESAGMRSKNKPPKQNTMRNQEKEGMREERERGARRGRKGHF